MREVGDESTDFPIFSVSAKTSQGLGLLKQMIHQRLVDEGFLTPFKIKG
jgi:hypothetical protein